MKKWGAVLLVLFLLLFNSSSAQTVLIKGVEADRPLVWDDFTGVPDDASPYDAFIYWNIRYRFQYYLAGDSVKVKPTVFLEIGDKSWVKKHKSNAALLRHEQGHFDIASLCAQDVLQMLETKSFPKENPVEAIKKSFSEVLETYKQMERAYDLDTNHSKMVKQQKKWEELLQKRLQAREVEMTL